MITAGDPIGPPAVFIFSERKSVQMPIIIPPELPAAASLQRENIFYYHTPRALSQDIRMLHILVLNLMPTKIATETQFVRLLGNTPKSFSGIQRFWLP